MTTVENSSTIIAESWFIPMDILRILCDIVLIVLCILFLLVILLDKTCHTVAMMLTANTCLSALTWGSVLLATSVIALENDLKQIRRQDSLCFYRTYIGYVGVALFHYSILLQTIYRYAIVVYPKRLICRSQKLQFLILCLTWLYCLLCPLGLIFSVTIAELYNPDDQICQVPLRFSIPLIYAAIYLYLMPLSIIMFIYLILVLYVRGMSQRITPANTLLRAKRELKMVHRIVILVAILITLGMPYVIFLVISFFSTPPKYYFRITFVFIEVSLVSVIVALFHYTDPLKASLMRKMQRRPNIVGAIIS